MHFVYKITCLITNKLYFGKSNEKRKRWENEHSKNPWIKKKPGQKDACPKLYRAMRKHGLKNFKYEIVEYFQTAKDAFIAEDKYINMYNTIEKGMNLQRGGQYLLDAKFYEHSDQAKAEVAKKKGKYPLELIRNIKRALAHQVSYTEITRRFGISRIYMGKIKRGTYFIWLMPKLNDLIDKKRFEKMPTEHNERAMFNNPNNVVSENDILEIKKLILAGNKYSHIAKQFNIENGVVERIAIGKQWNSIGPKLNMPKRHFLTEDEAKHIIYLWKSSQPIKMTQFLRQNEIKHPFMTRDAVRSIVENRTFKHLSR